MIIHTLEGVGTILTMIAFLSICAWAYSDRRKSSFDEAANLPFADDEPPQQQQSQHTSTGKSPQ